MTAESLDARITQALRDVAREQGLALRGHRLYGNGDTIVAFTPADDPRRVTALLPMDQTLRGRMTRQGRTTAGLRRILHADAFDDQADRDDARDLCRLGLVGCHALTETLPRAAISDGLRVRVLFDAPGVEVMTEGSPEGDARRGERGWAVRLGPDLVRLLWQFRPADRFARAYEIFHRQVRPAPAQG